MLTARHSKILHSILLIAISATLGPISQCHASARLIRVPLQRATSQSAGQYGQPVVNYFSTVQVGTPPISFQIQFDLALQNHFVPHYSWNPFSTNLHYGRGFQCKSSSTCKKDERSVSVEYQNCQLTGKRYEDQMTLVGVLQANLSAPASIHWRQNFLAISSASDARFSPLPVDGYFGLAPAPHSGASLKNLLVSLHEAKQIDNLQFSLWFNPVLDSPQGGELVLGGLDPTRYQGQIYWHHLAPLSYDHWLLNLQYVALGNQYVSCAGPAATGCQVRFSSGLSDIYGPREDVMRIYNLLNTSHQASGLQLIDCRRIAQLPTLTFAIDGIPYALLPSNYIRKTLDGKIFKKETCYVAILPAAGGEGAREWLLGSNFLGAYYSIYDITYRQVGFAALR